jgi:hypothetical protein
MWKRAIPPSTDIRVGLSFPNLEQQRPQTLNEESEVSLIIYTRETN